MFSLRSVVITTLLFSSWVNANGYVDKDHYLYPIMIDIRYHKYEEAIAKLEPYVEKGDAKALFWYGYMKQQNFGRDRYGAYKWFQQAGELGNPYALFKLSGVDATDDVCEVNGWECSSENLEKAIAIWKSQAERGDARAEYFYRKYSRSFIVKVYDLIAGNCAGYILDAARKGYVRPLIKAESKARNAGENYQDYWGEEMYQALLDNIDKDPQIAMYFVHTPYEGMTNEKRRKLYLGSLKKGYVGKHYDWAIIDGLISNEEAYVLTRSDHVGAGEDFDQKYYVDKFKVDEKKVHDLNKKSEEFFNSIEHVINFDETEFMFMFRPDV